MLSETQISEFKRQGYLMLPGLVSETVRGDLLSQLQEWVEESRQHDANYGFDTPNGKARFDLEQGHTAAHPRLLPTWARSTATLIGKIHLILLGARQVCLIG